ncbi:MAG: carboxypeptidase-like regulatory domain-containing protein [Oligoflexus sp.]
MQSKKFFSSLSIQFLLFFSVACANAGDQPTSDAAPPSLSPQPKPAPDDGSSADASFDTAGVIRFSLSQSQLADSLQAYIIGQAETHQAMRESATGSKFQIRNLSPGRYDVIFTAIDPATLSASQPSILGLRINGLQLSADRPLQLEPITLEATQTVSGKVHSVDGPMAGVEVRLTGTNYVAFTNAAGDYEILGVPKGHHRLSAQKEGFHPGKIELLRLEAGGTGGTIFELPELTLWENVNSGPGVLSPFDEENPAEQLAVLFVLIAPETANLMRVGEQVNLENASWQPLQTSLVYTFNNPGAKTLYVQFSKDRSQLSEIFQKEIVIQLP